MIRKKNNLHLDLLLDGMVGEVVMMVMVGMEEMGMMMMTTMTMMMRMMMMRMTRILKQLLKVKMGVNKIYLEEMVVGMMGHHLIQGVEVWALEEEGGIEVKEDIEVGQDRKVYQVHQDHRDLKD